jgi:hypothetical protein
MHMRSQACRTLLRDRLACAQVQMKEDAMPQTVLSIATVKLAREMLRKEDCYEGALSLCLTDSTVCLYACAHCRRYFPCADMEILALRAVAMTYSRPLHLCQACQHSIAGAAHLSCRHMMPSNGCPITCRPEAIHTEGGGDTG